MKPSIPSILLALILFIPPAAAQQQDASGEVSIPLETYNELVEQGRDPRTLPVAAPASYALGNATVQITVSETEARATGAVTVRLSAQVLVDEWVLVPLLSAGTAVDSATVEGKAVQLISAPEGLCWSTNKSGVYDIQLAYSVDAARSEQGLALGLPVPLAAASAFTATLPGSGLDVAVIPSAGAKVQGTGERTTVTATVPTTPAIHLSWRPPSDQGHAVSRATYRGTLEGDAVVFTGVLAVELFTEGTATLDLLPSSVTLGDVEIDGRSATILADGGRFTTLVKGRGLHEITLRFEVPVIDDDGPPRVDLSIPAIPVSRFELTLPGKKRVEVSPAASVTHHSRGATTVATVHVPLTEAVGLSWSEAVPEDIEAQLRANANVYHAAHAEEGVLYVTATVVYEVSRGETNHIELELPADAVVNDVRAAGGGVSEWSPRPTKKGKPQQISVFLDRQIKGEFAFDVLYERKLATGDDAAQPVAVPLLRAVDVNRQRGMVALLASKEFTLKPVGETAISAVGENQLPASVRGAVDKTIAHTFKYVDPDPELLVQPAPPERKEGKFDAMVDTLISISDVTMRGSATVEIDVKSGGIEALTLGIPAGVNLLSLSGPSLRTHKLLPGAGGAQVIDVQFTQEMEGQFRLEVVYEHIMADGAAEVIVPKLSVRAAEVEQGRVAIEALSAVEVQASTTEQLSSLDVSELPQQLVLRTTNPILLAYKYVHAEPPSTLGLTITRHREIDMQGATIDRADYRTLYTRDGLAVTTATYTVRNSRKQFLKVELPRDSEVWSVFVNGKAVKPAMVGAGGDDGGGKAAGDDAQVLIKIINSAEGFPVEIIYATDRSRIGSMGKVRGRLPRPDMVVTHTHWDVYVPPDVTYGTPQTNMELLGQPDALTPAELQGDAAFTELAGAGLQAGSLCIDVPTSGVRYSFEKLYANRSDEDAMFALPYTSSGGAHVARMLSVVGAALVWLGIFLAVRRHPWARPALGGVGLGLALLTLSVGYFGTGIGWAVVVSVLSALGIGGWLAYQRLGPAKAATNISSPAESRP